MKFKRVRPGEYRSPVGNGMSVWVLREGRHWFWFLGGCDMNGAWETDNQGPFASRKEAKKDAEERYEEFI